MIREAARRSRRTGWRRSPSGSIGARGAQELPGQPQGTGQNGFMTLNVKAALRRHGSRHGRLRAGDRGTRLRLRIDRPSPPRSPTWWARSSRRSARRSTRSAYLPRLADGTYPAGAFCLTESGAGSDPRRHEDARAARRRRLRHRRREDLHHERRICRRLRRLGRDRSRSAPKGKGISLLPGRARHAGPRHRQGREEDGPDRLAYERRAFRRLPRPRDA